MRRKRIGNRRGSVLIAVLVCMGVVTAIILGAVQTSVRQRRQLQQELQMEQTQRLLDAGVRMAIAELRGHVEYQGESITLSPTLEKYSVATLQISVDREGLAANTVEIHVTARVAFDKQSPITQRSVDVIVGTSTDNTLHSRGS